MTRASAETTLEGGRGGRRIVRTIIGAGMLAHSAWVLLGLPRSLHFVALDLEEVHTGELAWLWNAGLPLRSHLELGLWVLVNVGLAVGGISVIARRMRGMQLALVALAIAVIEAGLSTTHSLSLALGWVELDLHAVRPETHMAAGLSALPQSFQRWLWWWAVAGSAVHAGALLVAFLWLRRELAGVRS